MKSNNANNSKPIIDINLRHGPPRLLVKATEAAVMVGLHPRTLVRMEKAGVIRSLKLTRHRLYAVKDLEALVENARQWDKEGK